jgi:hypothetical protein
MDVENAVTEVTGRRWWSLGFVSLWLCSSNRQCLVLTSWGSCFASDARDLHNTVLDMHALCSLAIERKYWQCCMQNSLWFITLLQMVFCVVMRWRRGTFFLCGLCFLHVVCRGTCLTVIALLVFQTSSFLEFRWYDHTFSFRRLDVYLSWLLNSDGVIAMRR